jgi:hypothetical protein
MSEQAIQKRIWLSLSRGATRLFRCNVGVGWAGKTERVTPRNRGVLGASLRPGDVVVRNARPLRAGLQRGNGDLIGWVTMQITPEMVGSQVAVFASVEVKSLTGGARAHQRTWRDQVTAAGGLAGIARSVEDAERILAGNPS